MNQLHRPQRYVRKDPFPHLPYADDTSVPGDAAVGWTCIAGMIIVVLSCLY